MALANGLRVKTNRDSVRAGNIGRVLKGMVPASRAAYGCRYKADKQIAPDGKVIVKRAWWELDESGPDGQLLYPSPAWVVIQIFTWVGSEGRSLFWVANKLNETGIKAPDGGKWSPGPGFPPSSVITATQGLTIITPMPECQIRIDL